MNAIDQVVEAYTERDYTIYEYSSLEAVFRDEFIKNHFLKYDFVVIFYNDAEFVINMRKLLHAVFAENHVELKMIDETIYVNPDGIRVVP